MVAIKLDDRYEKRKQVVYNFMPPDIVILNLDNGYYFSTNEVGARIWELCDGKNTVSDIIVDISNLYQHDEKEIENDIMSLLQSFVKEELLGKLL